MDEYRVLTAEPAGLDGLDPAALGTFCRWPACPFQGVKKKLSSFLFHHLHVPCFTEGALACPPPRLPLSPPSTPGWGEDAVRLCIGLALWAPPLSSFLGIYLPLLLEGASLCHNFSSLAIWKTSVTLTLSIDSSHRRFSRQIVTFA